MNKPPGIPGEVRCGFFQEFVLHAEFAKFALGLGQLDPLMRGERGLIAGVVAPVLVHPVAERSLVHPEFPCDLGDRAGSVDHQSHRLIPELRTELAVLPCHSLHHLPGQILLDHGPRTTGHLRVLARDTTLWTDAVWVADSAPVECPLSGEAVGCSDLAGGAESGYCASHSRFFW